MADEMTTKPTIETVLERINEVGETTLDRINKVEETTLDRINRVEDRINKVEETTLDRFRMLEETVLEQINTSGARTSRRIDRLEAQMTERFEQVYAEIDRVASVAHSTKAEMLTLRADFRELRVQLKEVVPLTQAS